MVKYWTFYILSDIFIKAKFLYCFLSLKNCVFAFPKKSISLSFDGSSQKGFSLLNPLLLLLLLLWEFPQEKKNNVLRPLFAFAKGLSCSLEYSNCQKINLSHMCCLCFQDFFLDQNRKKKTLSPRLKVLLICEFSQKCNVHRIYCQQLPMLKFFWGDWFINSLPSNINGLFPRSQYCGDFQMKSWIRCVETGFQKKFLKLC